MTASETVGEAIERMRGARSVRGLAKAAGVSEGWWRQIELGFQQAAGVRMLRHPSERTLTKIAAALGATAEETAYLFELAGLSAPEVDPHPVGLGLDAVADGLTDEDVAPIRAALREMRRQRGLE